MLDFGTTASQNYAIAFVDRAILDAMTKYTICFTVRPRVASPWTNNRGLISKFTALTGWTLRAFVSGGTSVLRMIHGNGAATAGVSSTTVLALNTTYRVICAWDGSTLNFYINNGSAEGGALATAIAANANKINIGNEDGATVSPEAAIGQVFIYPNYVFSSGERTQWDAGQTVPAAGQLELWHKGVEVPGVDRVRGENAVLTGTVVTLSDPTDGNFPDARTIPQWRRLATHRLLRRRTQEPIFTLTVPDHYLSMGIAKLFQLSHDSMFLSASRLAGTPLGEKLASEPWRRSSVRLIGVTDNPLDHTVKLRFKDHEAFGRTYWSTDRLPLGTDDSFAGLGQLDVGGTHVATRASKAYLEQSNDVLEEPAFQAEGQYFRTVGAFVEKMNHIGFLAEDITDNPVLNSHAKNGETSWTSVDNSGTTDLSTLRLAYPLSVTGNSWRFVRANNSADTYREQIVAVLSADAFRRIYVVKTEQNATSIVSWQLQRSSDNWYWNDATPGWQSAAVWNRLSNAYDATISKPRFSRAISKPIDISSNQNWTIRVGLEGAALPAGGGEINVYSVEALKGKLRFSSVPTEGAAVTTSADQIEISKSTTPHLVPVTRYSFTCRLVAIQSGADLVDGDKLCIQYFQHGATADNYDVLLYEKSAGQNVRFSFERFLSGSFSARATFDVSIVPGTEYKIACIATASSGNDLGLSNNTLRILVDGVQGVDGVAGGAHSESNANSVIGRGYAPSATGYRRGMNYIWTPMVWTRCLTNEEAQAA